MLDEMKVQPGLRGSVGHDCTGQRCPVLNAVAGLPGCNRTRMAHTTTCTPHPLRATGKYTTGVGWAGLRGRGDSGIIRQCRPSQMLA